MDVTTATKAAQHQGELENQKKKKKKKTKTIKDYNDAKI
jgi:hypothetical protein